MKRAVLLCNYKVVRLEGKNYTITNPIYTSDGCLSQFTVGTDVYIFDAVIKYEKRTAGYFLKSTIQSVKNNPNDTEEIVLEKVMFDKQFEDAQVGDIFEIEKIDFYNILGQQDFTEYYNEAKYTFKIQTLQNKNLNFYTSSQYPVANSSTSDINAPNYSIVTRRFVDHSNWYSGRFYAKNFGDKVSGLLASGLTDGQIERIARYMVSICLSIENILEKQIMDQIAMSSLQDIATAINNKYTNGNSTQYNQLPFIDQIIGELRKDWGVYSIPPKDYFPTLDLGILQNFDNVLDGFYNSLYLMQGTAMFKYDSSGFPINKGGTPLTTDPAQKIEKDSDRRVIKIIQLLPSLSLSLFSPAHRLKLLEKVLDQEFVTQEKYKGVMFVTTDGYLYLIEDDVIKLVESFSANYTDANLLLDFLLQTKGYNNNEKTTKFERLYNLIDDSKHIIIDLVEYDNRKKLIDALYRVWETSKYNLSYIRPGAINIYGIDPDNYFLTPEGQTYFIEDGVQKECVIDLDGYKDLGKYDGTNYLYNGQDMRGDSYYIIDKNLFQNVIHIEKYSRVDLYPSNVNLSQSKTHLYFHLFQPITLIGYSPNLDLGIEIPNRPIPAFMYYYYEEYDRLKHSDALLNLQLTLLLDVGLFFVFGGANLLADLRYLSYFTKIGRVCNGTATATETLFFWKGIEGTSEAVALTSIIISNYNTYRAAIADTQEERDRHEKISQFFFYLALASVGGGILARKRAASAAKIVMEDARFGLLPQELIDLITNVNASAVLSVTEFETILNNYPILLNRYNALTPELRKAFYNNFFIHKNNLTVFEKLNNNTVFQNWLDLKGKNIAECADITFITNQKWVNSIKTFYDEPLLRPLLENRYQTSKRAFLEMMDGIPPTDFQKFVTDNTLINKWFKYYDDLALRDEFTALLKDTGGSHAKMIKWCERYGDISDEAISLIKHDPKGHINHLMDFPDATHNIAYFNRRRAEMLPPPFRDFGGDGKLYGTHEIDSFIELEILSSGKARASLTHEAGDIIMEGGTLHGLSLDPLGPTHKMANIISSKPNPNQFFTDIWLGSLEQGNNKGFGFLDSIRVHFEKISMPKNGKPALNKVVIDYKYFEDISLAIGQNPNYFKNYIDNFISNSFNEFDNSNFLIKLNH